MNTRDAIRRAVPVLVQYGHESVVLCPWLIRAGLSRSDAEAASRFVPLAFGREVLQGSGVQFSDTYVRVTGGVEEERPLAGEPFFAEAQAMASEIERDAVTTIAMQSSELQAVNAALNGGADLDGLVAGPPVIEWPAHLPAAPPRKWWQVWKR